MIAAAVTPRGKKGDLDFGAAFELVDFLCARGVRGIAFFTAAGEYPAFGLEERARLVYLATKRSRVPLFAGIGGITLDDSLFLAREAARAGAGGVLLPPPHFSTYGQEDLREFYLQFGSQVGVAANAYLVDTPTVASRIAPETARELLATGRFAGIQDAAGDAARFAGLPGLVLVGEDARFSAARRAGVHGAVSAAAGALPEIVVGLDHAIRTGNEGEVVRLDGLLQEFVRWAALFPFPVLAKVAAAERGLKVGAPTMALSAGRRRQLDEFKEWFRGVKQAQGARSAAG